MKTKDELQAAINCARTAMFAAEKELYEWESLAENNVYDDIELACSKIEQKLLDQAEKDCEGAHNCGANEYTQAFMVGGVTYVGTLSCEYNRHDKTYYYVSYHNFKCEVKE